MMFSRLLRTLGVLALGILFYLPATADIISVRASRSSRQRMALFLMRISNLT